MIGASFFVVKCPGLGRARFKDLRDIGPVTYRAYNTFRLWISFRPGKPLLQLGLR